MRDAKRYLFICATALGCALCLATSAGAQGPEFSDDFGRDRCTFTSAGSNPYFPLWPGYALLLEGTEEDDEGQLVEVASLATVLLETEVVDGVRTRVFEEREWEDDELVEVSRNYLAFCRETGDVWYFGEDVDDYEDGQVVGHGGAWRAGVNGAEPGILMPGSPILGARYYEEIAPGIAFDRAEIVAMGNEVTVPAGTYTDTLETVGTNPLDPGSEDHKVYARGVGVIVDEALQLVEVTAPACQPDARTLCLNDGRFQVRADWEDPSGNEGDGTAILPSDDSGEFWFFGADNTELVVKVLDGCAINESYWVFAAGLTDVAVTIEVTDTSTGQLREYDNPLGTGFVPILDTSAFATCP
jgi:hypothetical protein